MALTLANTIDAADQEIEVNGAVPAAIDIGYRFRLDDEFLELRAFGRSTVTVLGGAATESVRNVNQWAVARGLERTTAASHTSGASILGTLPAVAVGTTEVLPEPYAASSGSGVTVTVSATDPGAVGAGNLWVQTYDDTAITGVIFAQTLVRNAADDGWLRPSIFTTAAGVLRTRISVDTGATGGDMEVRDANGDSVFLAEFGAEGSFSIRGTSADGFTKMGKVDYDPVADELIIDLTVGAAQVGSLFMDAASVILSRTFGESVTIDAAGVHVTTAGVFDVNGDVVATVP